VDLGNNRSDYHDVARELARALNMNYTFGVEFVEVDPLTLGIQKVQLDDKELAEKLQADIQADPKRYRGLHGSAVLSGYPIRNVKILRLPVCHDWYHDEIKPVPGIEKLKRSASDKVFLEEITQERRRGGRIAMILDLSVPDVPSGVVTVVNAHLENKCKPACRQQQMDFIQEHIRVVKNPVILAGDMNTTGSDGSILSISYLLREKVKDYRFWTQQLISILNPISLFGADTLARYYRNYLDPTVRDIPVIGANREYGLFEELREFRFEDGGAIDFSGNKQKTVNGRSGTLANSNQRAAKGFVYTFSLPRDFKGLVGRFKLDWFFIKPLNPPTQGAVMAPEFARTMQSLNGGPPERISDHAPITVDLPLKAAPAIAP
jgi:endonuclease/exonuclease/phosphatase family metal-dependent hydrolase